MLSGIEGKSTLKYDEKYSTTCNNTLINKDEHAMYFVLK